MWKLLLILLLSGVGVLLEAVGESLFSSRRRVSWSHFEDRIPRYRRQGWIDLATFLPAAGASTWILGTALLRLHRVVTDSATVGATHMWTANPSWVWFGAAVGGFLIALVPVLLLARLRLGSDFNEYLLYQDTKSGTDSRVILGFLGSVGLVLAATLALFVLDYRIVLYPDRAEYNFFFGIGAVEKPYDELAQVEERSPGEGSTSRWVLVYNDQVEWTLPTPGQDLVGPTAREAALAVAAASGVEIVSVGLEGEAASSSE